MPPAAVLCTVELQPWPPRTQVSLWESGFAPVGKGWVRWPLVPQRLGVLLDSTHQPPLVPPGVWLLLFRGCVSQCPLSPLVSSDMLDGALLT